MTLKHAPDRETGHGQRKKAEALTGSRFGLTGEVNPEGRFDTLAISNPGWDTCRFISDGTDGILIRR